MQILNGNVLFADNIEVAHLSTISKEDVLQFYKDLVCNDAPKRHKLCVHISSTLSEADETDNSTDKVETTAAASSKEVSHSMDYCCDIGGDTVGPFNLATKYSRARLIRMANARKNHANYPSMRIIRAYFTLRFNQQSRVVSWTTV